MTDNKPIGTTTTLKHGSLLRLRYSPRRKDTGRTISAYICGCGKWRQECQGKHDERSKP